MKKIIGLVLIAGICFSASSQSRPKLPPLADLYLSLPQPPDMGQHFPALELPECSEQMTCATGTLPVDFLDIKATRLNESLVEVKWEIANEVNIKGYYVERSFGNSNQFREVGFVLPLTSTDLEKKYVFEDYNDYSGISFYRIREQDIDDRKTYSKIVSVDGYAKNNHLNIFPNPATDIATLRLYFNENQKVTITVYDGIGKVMFRREQLLSTGLSQQQLSVANWGRGMYLIEVKTETIHLTTRLIKQ